MLNESNVNATKSFKEIIDLLKRSFKRHRLDFLEISTEFDFVAFFKKHMNTQQSAACEMNLTYKIKKKITSLFEIS